MWNCLQRTHSSGKPQSHIQKQILSRFLYKHILSDHLRWHGTLDWSPSLRMGSLQLNCRRNKLFLYFHLLEAKCVFPCSRNDFQVKVESVDHRYSIHVGRGLLKAVMNRFCLDYVTSSELFRTIRIMIVVSNGTWFASQYTRFYNNCHVLFFMLLLLVCYYREGCCAAEKHASYVRMYSKMRVDKL